MGLLDNTKNIELAIVERNRQRAKAEYRRELREQERRQKQEEAENLKRLENDIIREINIEFEEAARNGEELKIYYLNEKYYTLLNNIIKQYGKTKNVFDYVTGKNKIKYINQYEIKNIYDKHYYKILKQKENIIKIQNKIKEEQEAEKIQYNNTKQTNYSNILKACGIVAAAPVAIIGAALFGAIKASK